MSGLRKILRIIRGTGSVTSADSGSRKVAWSSIMLNPKDLAELTETDWKTYGQPTVVVTNLKAAQVIPVPDWLKNKIQFEPISGDRIICTVCRGTYVHEYKCPNHEQPLRRFA
jgi:hypothetical protein